MNAWITPLALTWIAAINLTTWAAFVRDKRAAAAGQRRTPERMLLTLALLGGAPAAIAARRALRHKTRKARFGAVLWLFLMVQAGAAIVWIAR